MKLCSNCKHNDFSNCLRSSKVRACSKERRTGKVKAYFSNKCGLQGRFFKTKGIS